AGMLLLVPKGTKPLRQGVIIGITILSLFLAGELFDEEIDALSEGKDKVFSWIEDFEVPTFEWGNGLQFDFITNNEQLNNNQPNYTGEKVFEMKADKQPSTSIYLRGFCGTDYVKGTWKWDKSIFQEACKKAGYSEQKSAQILAGFPYAVLVESEAFPNMDMEMELTYVSSTGNTAYVPYVFDYESFEKDYDYNGDYLIKKDILDKTISVTGSITGDTRELSYYTYYAKYVDGYDTMQWYNQVAAEYAKSTNSMECIKAGADFVNTWVDYPTEEELWLSSSMIMYDNEMLDVLLENLYRMDVATWVRTYLAYNMRYSVILDNLPAGADPVEYALTEGKEGYCMHYASAATLIFKELGVPARYVSGYIVRPSDFVWNVDEAYYLAEVEDYNSHAWVEIYLDNIGWVPIEVTEGYENVSEMLPTERDPQEFETEEPTESESESESETETETESESESESELPTESESESESETETKTDSESEKDTQSESEGDTENTEGSGGGQGLGGIITRDVFKEVMSFATIAVLILVAIYGVKVLLVRYEYVLEQEIKKNQTRRAVKRINKRIYRVLRLTKPLKGQLTDAQYEQILVETYTKVSAEEWARYMDIVKKMHYSHEEISHEEMMHCYWCYKNYAGV
ncbi:MAG: transglutaminase domain-containing protein, partial [Agathobacter sp.]|nr:transglutaminase domain-containing protein [Agathobacter sp.]